MIEKLAIRAIGHRGDGLADAAGEEVYVPYALPGETVTVEAIAGQPDRRHLLHVDTPSAERIAPICPHFGVCGGCAVQHWREDRYRAWKRDLVVSAVRQAGLNTPVEDLIDAHGEGRRRVVLHARRGTRGILEVGFAAPRAHRIVPIDRCPILAPPLGRAIEIAWKLAEALEPQRKPLDIQITATDAGLDVDVRGSGALAPRMQTILARCASDLKLARLTRHGELLAQTTAPMLRIGKAAVILPPGGFLQATAEGEATLARLVVAHAKGAAKVVDLFCGVGPFALRLAETARVTAFDSDEAATAALRQASLGVAGVKPVEAAPRDLFRLPLIASELKPFDAVVFDPPRQGAHAQASQLATSRVERVIAVSCNPATFARDARALVDGGYRLERITPVDQFRYSAHVEFVALLRR